MQRTILSLYGEITEVCCGVKRANKIERQLKFGAGRYSEDFESAAFALKKDGEISRPLLTSFGYHIIQRVESIPVNTDPHNEAAH